MTLQHERSTSESNGFKSNLYVRVSSEIGRHVIAPLLSSDAPTFNRHQHGGDFYLRLAAIQRAHTRVGLEVANKNLVDELKTLREHGPLFDGIAPVTHMSIDVLKKYTAHFIEQPPDFRMMFHLDYEVEELIRGALLRSGADLASRLTTPGNTGGLLEITPNYTEFDNPRDLAMRRDAFNDRLGALSGAAIKSLYFAQPGRLHTSIT